MLGDVPLIKSNISRRSCYTRVENNIKQATKYRNGSDLWLDDKIVKVNKLYLNSLLVSIVNRVSQSRTMKYQREWKHRCVKQEMVTYVAKERQPFLLGEVVQRWKSHLLTSSAAKTRLVSSGGRPETGAIPVFHRWQE